jgi:hypothetical protein
MTVITRIISLKFQTFGKYDVKTNSIPGHCISESVKHRTPVQKIELSLELAALMC